MTRASAHLGLRRAFTIVAPADLAPAPARRGAARARGAESVRGRDAPLTVRLRVHLTRGALDRRIARGYALDATAALALRARQLAAEPTRRALAGDLRRAVEYAERVESRTRLSAVMLEPARVRAGRGAIIRLAERLEQTAPVSPQGVALARLLLTDAASPLFDRDSERTVTEASAVADDALVCGPLAPQPPQSSH